MRIGIDLGGTKIEGVALAGDGHVLQRRQLRAQSLRILLILAVSKTRAQSLTGKHASAILCHMQVQLRHQLHSVSRAYCKQGWRRS